MIVKTIHGAGSHVESIDGNMMISNCNITVEENMLEQLNDLQIINSIIELRDKTIYTSETGKFVSVFDKENKTKDKSDFYKNEGIAIYIKGQLFYGIHPDNLESNLEALINGGMKINWEAIKERIVNKD